MPNQPLHEPGTLYRTAGGVVAVDARFRVRYFETDAMGVVHHASYITWFEEGRSAFMRALGYPYSQLESEGVSLAVAEVSARYHRASRYDQEVRVTATMTEFQSRGVTFHYEVRRETDGELLVSGFTKHISVDREGRVIRIHDQARLRMQAGLAGVSA